MKLTDVKNQFADGLFNKNPLFVQVLGTCASLAITTTVKDSIAMGIAVTAVLTCSNLLISLLRKFIPNEVRIASYIVIISGFVTIVEMLMNAYLPDLAQSLGAFLALIVVNCIILARAESYASKNKPLPSVVDGIAMGLGFTLALFLLGSVRELFGAGTFLGFSVFGKNYTPIGMLTSPPGAFIVLGCLIALFQYFKKRFSVKKAASSDAKPDSGKPQEEQPDNASEAKEGDAS
ncbi:MAG: electron transport complex subunit E [Clostridia bacterium]|nr:electron transport complex subunit E [Clostridia bacterium]